MPAGTKPVLIPGNQCHWLNTSGNKIELNVANNSLSWNRLGREKQNNNEIVPALIKTTVLASGHINTQTITKTNKQMKGISNKKYKKIKYPTYSHWFIINHVILPSI
ncbi:hypothetical protein KCP76_21020 [Salmonella enterica subsp. enterica serovar Weltevreden]|nr:hypothetical protein KCP76_21020 [Salmonella enterica subsp. enterica serovar Weltevreden]